MKWSEFENKKVGIWGMGREGQSVLKALKKHVSQCQIIEIDEEKLNLLDDCQIVVKSPGVSLYRDEIKRAKEKGIIITSGTNVFMANKNPKSKVICITGTKGKSTTSSLLARTLKVLGYSVCFGGNIGKPLLDFVDETPDFFVAEISSYQCADLVGQPDLGIMVALYSAHLPWHGSLAQYHKDKMNMILQSRQTIDIRSLDVRVQDGYFYNQSERLFSVDALPLYGAHNRENACVVLQAIKTLGLNLKECEKAFQSFEPLAHRLQKVGQINGVLYINDSIATLPESVMVALDTFADRPITLIVGGWDGGYDYTALDKMITERKILALALPDTGAKINTPYHVANMAEAVRLAYEKTPSGGVVLMSPGAPSYNQYKNFEERGEDFIKLVGKLKDKE